MQRRLGTRSRTTRGSYATLGGWLWQIARLDFSVFEEVRGEPTAGAGAVIIVLGASVFAGIGSWLWAVQHDLEGLDTVEVFVKTILAGSLLQLGVWFLWVFMVQFVLVRGFAANITYPELLRPMGIAFAPVALSVLVAVAPLAVPFGVFSLGLAFLFSNFAVEQSAGVTTREATFANLAGFGTFLVFMGALANVLEAGPFGGLAPGLLWFALDF